MPSWVCGKLAIRAELSTATRDNHRASKKEIRCDRGFGRAGGGVVLPDHLSPTVRLGRSDGAYFFWFNRKYRAPVVSR
jgi:hypothetical protein